MEDGRNGASLKWTISWNRRRIGNDTKFTMRLRRGAQAISHRILDRVKFVALHQRGGGLRGIFPCASAAPNHRLTSSVVGGRRGSWGRNRAGVRPTRSRGEGLLCVRRSAEAGAFVSTGQPSERRGVSGGVRP